MLWVDATPAPGDDIDETAREAIQLARTLGVGVRFRFNGIRCRASRSDAPQSIVRHFEREIARPDSPYRVGPA